MLNKVSQKHTDRQNSYQIVSKTHSNRAMRYEVLRNLKVILKKGEIWDLQNMLQLI